MMRLGIGITTYRRRRMCRTLLRTLRAQAAAANVWATAANVWAHVVVLEDRSTARPALHLAALADEYVLMNEHHGREAYAALVTELFARLRLTHLRRPFDYILILPDDVEPVLGMIETAVDVFEEARAFDRTRRIGVLNLVADQRAGTRQWVDHDPVRVTLPSGRGLWHTEWQDMAFLTVPAVLDYLGWRVEPLPAWRWHDPQIGSGVGSQIAKRLHRSPWQTYQVVETLLYHGDHPSHMHPSRSYPLTTDAP